ncbi:tetratricopeptide repeat protein [Pararhodonellum marinum]|uniref:tetratricopeptide repeat protein n=1 Tax=Pararhodonellum marinum TaxID=2755358 RepID=UPI0018900E6C|nr:tetratricopeptide repeat protein [Pararhodonellum marinum]
MSHNLIAQNPPQLFKTGMGYYDNQDFSKAIFYFTKSIEGDSEFFATFLYRGLAKNNLGDYIGAISDFNRAIILNEDMSYMSYLNRGLAKDRLEDYRGAISDFNKAIQKEPNEIAPFFNRGLSKSKLNDCKGAILDLNRVISSNPNLAEAYFLRGLCFIMSGEQDRGCIDLSKAGELGSAKSYPLIRDYCN